MAKLKVLVISITPVLQDFTNFFLNIFSFQHVFHFDVGRSQMEWNVKMRGETLVCTAIMLNDHGNPYNIIESTTVLSDDSVYLL